MISELNMQKRVFIVERNVSKSGSTLLRESKIFMRRSLSSRENSVWLRSFVTTKTIKKI
jgi:hypothetical protein